jgi:hypothetical protein
MFNNYTLILLIPYFIFFLFSILYVINNKEKDNRIYFYIIISLALLIREIFAIKIPYYAFQHDFGKVNTYDTLGYINYLFTYGKLPLSNLGQFYHPPLMYAICAVFVKINTLIGISFETSLESLQIVTVSISMTSLFFIYKIINKLKIKMTNKLWIFLLICFHPQMIILSCAINTDNLVTLFVVIIIYLLILWNDKPSYKNTILLAIATGLAVMSKFSAAVMAIPILFIFINKLFKNKKYKDYFKKYILFGIISLPIGLWYEIRNIILFGSNSILIPAKEYYIGNYSIVDRFLSIDFGSLSKILCVLPGEYNIPSFIIKTSLFGDYLYNGYNYINIILLVLNIILIITSLIMLFKNIIRIKKGTIINKLFIVIYITYIISFIIFNIMYPYSCTMDFRYILITLIPSISIMIYEIECINNKLLDLIVKIFILLFIVFSIIWINCF